MAERLQYFRQQAVVLALTALPTVVLFGEYLFAKGLSFRKSGDSGTQMWSELARLTSLCTMMEVERNWTVGVALLFLALVVAAFWTKTRSRSWGWTDILLGAFLVSLFIYFKQPGSFAGARHHANPPADVAHIWCCCCGWLPWIFPNGYKPVQWRV
jgi:hypothetical protein